MTSSFESPISEQPESSLVFIEVERANLNDSDILHLKGLYGGAYGDNYVGDEVFDRSTLPNTSSVAMYKKADQLIAAINLNVDRMIAIAVSHEVQNRGEIMVKLLQQLVQTHPKLWVTVGVEAKAMQATITNTQLHFKPVDSAEDIKELFQSINGVVDLNSIITNQKELDFLARRLGKDALFTIVTNPSSLHGEDYEQIVFQNS